ncbi:unnamed protein product [Nippostrongylus brasiliensis]|uniref:Nose resistant to fluoxetine protein 6 n=1 Tax=Nippostrongylus brasiliensis TaxID=27835 RepID=A0A0N4Y516_NIPBR|nr:unnamed protein product [Nippostrongylus brasiliensis]
MVLSKRSSQDEVDQMCKRTTLWLEGKGSFYLENAFYIDAALSLLMAFTHFAFPQHILKIVITSEYTLDSHHIMWCRMFGCLSILPALCSLSARHLPPHVQTHYLASRLITQVIVFFLNIFGHWVLSIYSPNHISGFMISGFYMSFLFSAFYRASSHYKDVVPPTLRSKSKAS